MRLFLGFAPARAERDIYGLCDRLGSPNGLPEELPLRWVPPENWHITVVYLGNVAERALGRLSDTVATVMRDQPHMSVTLDGLEWFPSPLKPRLLAMHVAAHPQLMELQAAVASALRREGFHSEQRAYRPHLTLARLKGSRKLLDPPPLPPAKPIKVELNELVLFESHQGSRPYTPLQRFGMAA